jgi:uncharacterized protein
MTAPVPSTERIDALDALRGFALAGILLANILYWSGWTFLQPGEKLALAGANAVHWQYVFHHALVDGKFYTLFSLMFGAGFALQLDRLQRRGAEGIAIFRRRMLVLLAIGTVHMVFIWDGDILFFYALIGLTLPWFVKLPDRTLLIASAILVFVVPLAGFTLFESLGWKPHKAVGDFGDAIFTAMGGTLTDPVGWLKREGLYPFWTWTMGGWPYAIATRLESWRIPKLLGIMLLGIVAGRRLSAGTLIEDRKLLWRVFWGGLLIGAPLNYLYATTPDLAQTSLPSLYGTVPQALAYGAGFLLLWPHAKGVLRHLAPAGRMALTNYLMQTVLGISIFYGIGFGLIGSLPPAGFYAVAAGIYAFQLVFSRLWLARHEQGPMERLWRLGTYGRMARPAPA